MNAVIDFLFALAVIQSVSLASPLGLRAAWGLEIDDSERGSILSVALLMTAAGTVAAALIPGLMMMAVWAGLSAALVMMVAVGFNMRLGVPSGRATGKLVKPNWRNIVYQLVFGLGGAVLVKYFVPEAVFGYALGLFVFHMARVAVVDEGSWREVRCTFISSLVTIAALGAVILYPLWPRECTFVIVGGVFSAALAFVIPGAPHRLVDLLPATFMALVPRLPVALGMGAACVLFLLFALLMRKALYEALLPARAWFIRRRAARKRR